MMRYLIVLVFIAVTMSAPVHSALIKSYDFVGDYTDTLGNGDNIINSGTGADQITLGDGNNIINSV